MKCKNADRNKEMESSTHLFQRPWYNFANGRWTTEYEQALKACPTEVELDLAAVLSYLSFGYASGNRTLLKAITRRPWLSSISAKGEPVLEKIPHHGLKAVPVQEISQNLYTLLCAEAEEVCRKYKHIYLLLSGGLDSRIIAGVLAELYRKDLLPVKPRTITWGFPDSRDAVYAQTMSEILGFEWQNIPYGPATMFDNIQATVRHLGLIHSPELLHNMLWFKNLPAASLVLAASFGDSIGRAEFAGRHLLQLKPLSAQNSFNLLKPDVFAAASQGIDSDAAELVQRAGPDTLPHARAEHWMQAYRMRSGLCHALTIINRNATIYQMFTARSVYEYMWSIHPAFRGNDIYKAILENKLPRLARIPWARTNRALSGKTVGARCKLRADYHAYTRWCAGPLYNELKKRIDPDWFQATGIFEPVSIGRINTLVRRSRERVGRLNDIWIWLAGFRDFVEQLQAQGKKLKIKVPAKKARAAKQVNACQTVRESWLSSAGITAASSFRFINTALKTIRTKIRKHAQKRLKKKALRCYPPEKNDEKT